MDCDRATNTLTTEGGLSAKTTRMPRKTGHTLPPTIPLVFAAAMRAAAAQMSAAVDTFGADRSSDSPGRAISEAREGNLLSAAICWWNARIATAAVEFAASAREAVKSRWCGRGG